MLDEMQQQMRSEIIGKFGLAQAQRLGLIASHSVRLDAREVRLEAEGTVRDDNLRIRLDGDSTKEQRDFEERIATMGCRTDGQRAGALKKLEREREQSAWVRMGQWRVPLHALQPLLPAESQSAGLPGRDV